MGDKGIIDDAVKNIKQNLLNAKYPLDYHGKPTVHMQELKQSQNNHLERAIWHLEQAQKAYGQLWSETYDLIKRNAEIEDEIMIGHNPFLWR